MADGLDRAGIHSRAERGDRLRPDFLQRHDLAIVAQRLASHSDVQDRTGTLGCPSEALGELYPLRIALCPALELKLCGARNVVEPEASDRRQPFELELHPLREEPRERIGDPSESQRSPLAVGRTSDLEDLAIQGGVRPQRGFSPSVSARVEQPKITAKPHAVRPAGLTTHSLDAVIKDDGTAQAAVRDSGCKFLSFNLRADANAGRLIGEAAKATRAPPRAARSEIPAPVRVRRWVGPKLSPRHHMPQAGRGSGVYAASVQKLTAITNALLHLWWTLFAAHGIRGVLAVLRLKSVGVLRREERGGKDAEPVAVPMDELGGRDLFVRPATTDMLMAVMDYRAGLNLPPPEVANRPMKRIVELGVNAGGALASLGHRYPEARLLGAEPDPRNVALARRNVASFGERAEIVQAAIWDRDTELVISGEEAFGLTVAEREPGAAIPDGASLVPALSIDSLLSAHAPDEEIDFMLLTIEGAEPRVLAAGGDWPSRVRSIRVELHQPLGYLADDCLAQLRVLGFRAHAQPDLFGGWVLGVRE